MGCGGGGGSLVGGVKVRLDEAEERGARRKREEEEERKKVGSCLYFEEFREALVDVDGMRKRRDGGTGDGQGSKVAEKEFRTAGLFFFFSLCIIIFWLSSRGGKDEGCSTIRVQVSLRDARINTRNTRNTKDTRVHNR